MVARFLAYAARLLRRVGGIPGVEPEDVLAAATLSCLGGGRTWPADQALDVYFRKVMVSELRHLRRASCCRKWVALDEVPELPAPPSRREELIVEERRHKALEEAIAEDGDLRALVNALAMEGAKRADVARKLGWRPALVTSARRKLQRRIDAQRRRDEDSDERLRKARSRRKAPPPR